MLFGVVGLLCLGIAAATGIEIWTERQKGIANAEEGLSKLSLTLAEATLRTMQGLDLVVVNLQERVSAAGLRTREDLHAAFGGEPFNKMLQERIRDLPQIDALAIQDETGRIVNFSREWPGAVRA